LKLRWRLFQRIRAFGPKRQGPSGRPNRSPEGPEV